MTTIPAAANIGVAAAYDDWPAWRGSMAQLAINLVAILVSGTVDARDPAALYHRRQRRHDA